MSTFHSVRIIKTTDSPEGETVILLDENGLSLSENAMVRGLLRDKYHLISLRMEQRLVDGYFITIPFGVWSLRSAYLVIETPAVAASTVTIKACQENASIADSPSQFVDPIPLDQLITTRAQIIPNPLPLETMGNFALAYTGDPQGLNALMTIVLERSEE